MVPLFSCLTLQLPFSPLSPFLAERGQKSFQSWGQKRPHWIYFCLLFKHHYRNLWKFRVFCLLKDLEFSINLSLQKPQGNSVSLTTCPGTGTTGSFLDLYIYIEKPVELLKKVKSLFLFILGNFLLTLLFSNLILPFSFCHRTVTFKSRRKRWKSMDRVCRGEESDSCKGSRNFTDSILMTTREAGKSIPILQMRL